MMSRKESLWCSMLQHVAACCSMLQCIAVRCSAKSQKRAPLLTMPRKESLWCSALQCIAVHCSALQCLQCVAVRCSASQCVAVRCSVCITLSVTSLLIHYSASTCYMMQDLGSSKRTSGLQIWVEVFRSKTKPWRVTHSYVGHDLSYAGHDFVWLIHMWDMTQLICGTWLSSFVWDMTRWYVGRDSGLSDMWDMTHLIRAGHDSFSPIPQRHMTDTFVRGTLLIHIWDMTRSLVGHDSSIRGTWLIYMWNMSPRPQSDISDVFACGTWLVHTWDVTRPHGGHDSFTRGTWPQHLRVTLLTYSRVGHYSMIKDMIRSAYESLIYAPFKLIRSALQMERNSFTYETWLIYTGHESFGPCVCDLCALQIIFFQVSHEQLILEESCRRRWLMSLANGVWLILAWDRLVYMYDMPHEFNVWLIILWSMHPSIHFNEPCK